MIAFQLLLDSAFERFEQLSRASGQCPNLTEFIAELETETDLPREQWLNAVVEGLLSIQGELEQQAGRQLDQQQLLRDNPDYTSQLESIFRPSAITRGLMSAPSTSAGEHRADSSALAMVPQAIAQQWSMNTWQRPGAVIGVYTLETTIGEGGMGTVWRARQDQPVRRYVAIKLIKPNIDSRRVARFEMERQTLAMMDHPYIAKVLEAGTTKEGQPYFVMELVDGLPIHRYCDLHCLTIRQRLNLFLRVCHAVQHAHQKGIIHRDLKPSNVLVTLNDGDHVAKVIDFGLAKAFGDTDGFLQVNSFTEFGQIVGTFQYMSPEQARTSGLDIDTRSDVYSLGVMLFELLTGSTPIQREVWQAKSVLSALEAVRDHEPQRPSERLRALDKATLEQVAASRQVEPFKFQALCCGELDWIVMKSLDKDRTRRYQSAASLAEDVQNYLSGECVVARPPSWSYKLGKIWRKQKVLITATCTVFLVLLASLLITTRLLLTTKAARDAADEALVESQAKSRALTLEQQRTKQALLRSLISESELLTNQPEKLGWSWQASEKAKVAMSLDPPMEELSLLRSLILKCETALDARLLHKLDGPYWFKIAFSPDGEHLAAGQAKDNYTVEIRIYNTTTWQVKKSLKINDNPMERVSRFWEGKKSQEGIETLTYSPDGRWFMAGTRQGKVFIWDAQRDYVGPVTWTAYDKGRVGQAVFTTDGSTLVTASNEYEDFASRAWQLRDDTWSACTTSLPPKVEHFSTTVPGLLGVASGKVLLWFDRQDLKPIELARGLASTHNALSNSRLAVASRNTQAIQIEARWTGGTLKHSHAILDEPPVPSGVTFSPNDQHLLVHSSSAWLRVCQSFRQPTAAIKIPMAGRSRPASQFSPTHSQIVATAAEGLDVYEIRELPSYVTRLAAEGLAEIEDMRLDKNDLWLVGWTSDAAKRAYQVRRYDLNSKKLQHVTKLPVAQRSLVPPRFVATASGQPVEVLIPDQAWLRFNTNDVDAVDCLWPTEAVLTTEKFDPSVPISSMTTVNLRGGSMRVPDWLKWTRMIHRPAGLSGYISFSSKAPAENCEVVRRYESMGAQPTCEWENSFVDRMTGNAVLMNPVMTDSGSLCGGKDAIVRLFDHRAQLKASAACGRGHHISLAARGDTFAVGTDQGDVWIGGLAELKIRSHWQAHAQRVDDLALLEGDRCLTCTRDEVKMWSTSATPALLVSLPLHGARASRLVACAQGERCLIAFKECPEIEIWNMRSLASLSRR